MQMAIAPPGQEGWLCEQENVAKHPLSAQTGWWFKLKQVIRTTTPALRATPPVQEGRWQLVLCHTAPMKFTAAALISLFLAMPLLAQISQQRPPEGARAKATVDGKILKVEITSSRVSVYVAVPNPDTGGSATWTIHTGVQGEAARNIPRSNLKPGVTIRVTGTVAGDHVLEAAWADISFPQD